MKRYIKASSDEINNDIIQRAVELSESIPHAKIDLDNHIIVIPFSKNDSEEELMEPGMIGNWFKENGFNLAFEKRDFEYTTKGDWMNYRGWIKEEGHTAYLRDRLVLTVTW